MKIFGQIIRTVVNTATLPVALAQDAFTLGGLATEQRKPYTMQALEKLKREAEED
jgi:hypothetical protein